MSFTVPGSTWVPRSAQEHAETVLSAINTALAPLNITFTPKLGNVVWLFCLGIGEVAALFDESLESAKNSFNPALADDDQLLHMLPVTGLTRIVATPSTLTVNFTATADGALTVPAGTHVQIANQTYMFTVDEEVVVPVSTTAPVQTTCDTTGPIQVAPAQVTGAVETLTNFASCANSAYTVAGRDTETVAALRVRIINGLSTYNNLDGFTLALRALSGISQAKVYFNESTTTPLVLPGSISVPARTLYIVVSGASALIAQTWAERSMVPTHGPEIQSYETLSGQLFAVHYANAGSQAVYVRVFVSSAYTRQTGYDVKIEEAIESLTLTSELGKTVTVEDVLSVLANFIYATINSAEVSLNGTTYGRTAIIDADSMPSFLAANVVIVEEP